MELKFKEITNCLSQRTMVKLLKKYSYKFVPINEYENELFYCMLEYPVNNNMFKWFFKMFKWLGAKEKVEYVSGPLSLTICNEVIFPAEPMVFDREEIKRIFNDVPEHYVGDDTI